MEIEISWNLFLEFLENEIGGKHTLESVLLLVGVREMGWTLRKFKKEEKVDLMHVGLCTILEPAGYYQKLGLDTDGWPHWDIIKPIPDLKLYSQVNFIREHLLVYFSAVYEKNFLLADI